MYEDPFNQNDHDDAAAAFVYFLITCIVCIIITILLSKCVAIVGA